MSQNQTSPDRQTTNHDAKDQLVPSRPAAYRAPRMVASGRTVELLQGTYFGAYEDGYTGYKWDR